jgi:hypothetical protein
VLVDELPDDMDRGIVLVGDGADDFESRVLLLECGFEVVIQIAVEASQGA